MPDPNAEPPELQTPFITVKLTFKDGRTQLGFWNNFRWSSRGLPVDAKTILIWEPRPDNSEPYSDFGESSDDLC